MIMHEHMDCYFSSLKFFFIFFFHFFYLGSEPRFKVNE